MGSLGSRGSVLALLQLPAVSAVLDQEKEWAQLVMGPGLSNILQGDVPSAGLGTWCHPCTVPQFLGPCCCTWGAGIPCHEYFCLPQLEEGFVGLGNGSVPIPPSPATVPVMDEGAPDVAEEFVQRWFLQVRLLQGG